MRRSPPGPCRDRSHSQDATAPPPIKIVRFFFNDTAPPEIYTTANTLSLHDALPISGHRDVVRPDLRPGRRQGRTRGALHDPRRSEEHTSELQSLAVISYAVFCL